MSKKLTKKEAHKIHQALWTWLSENPDKGKSSWPDWKENKGSIPWCANHCPACEYEAQHPALIGYCGVNCIIAWPAGYGCQWMFEDKGQQHEIYNQWYYSDDLKLRASLAKQIADLPLRKRRNKK